LLEVQKLEWIPGDKQGRALGQYFKQDDCLHEMMVEIQWKERRFNVPLAQLQPLNKDKKT